MCIRSHSQQVFVGFFCVCVDKASFLSNPTLFSRRVWSICPHPHAPPSTRLWSVQPVLQLTPSSCCFGLAQSAFQSSISPVFFLFLPGDLPPFFSTWLQFPHGADAQVLSGWAEIINRLRNETIHKCFGWRSFI